MADTVMRVARKRAGLTMSEVGQKVGLSTATLTLFETGRCGLSIPNLLAYAEAVGMTALAEELRPVVEASGAKRRTGPGAKRPS